MPPAASSVSTRCTSRVPAGSRPLAARRAPAAGGQSGARRQARDVVASRAKPRTRSSATSVSPTRSSTSSMPPEPSPRRRASAARFCRAVSEDAAGPSTNPATPAGRASVLRTGHPKISSSPPSARAGRPGPAASSCPAPLGPTRPCTFSRRDVEIDVVERDHLAKGLDDSARTDGELLGSTIDRRLRRPRGPGIRRPAGAPAGRRIGLLSGACPETRQCVSELGMYAPGTRDGA